MSNHPEENSNPSSNPDRNALVQSVPGQRPRSATIVITRDDGGEIGI